VRSRAGNHRRAIKLAKQLSDADKRGVGLGLNDDEVAFYDALAQNNSAVEVMGKDNLKIITTELVTQVRKSVIIDWTLHESARAKTKVLVKRILRKHGYPPDLQEEATGLALQRADLVCVEWAA
jgi:type I restriction enzyme R subunit